MRTRKRAQVGAARGDDAVDVGVGGDGADRHRRNSRLVTDAIAEGRLIQAAVDRSRVGDGLAGFHL